MHPMIVIVLAQRSLTKLDTMSNLIKEGYFNLSTVLNFKKPMDVPIEYIQTRAYEDKQRKHEFRRSSYVQMEIGELVVTYLSVLTTCM